ncbi:MAG: ankyrin repeat domain-containing protein [Candidatus Micrarchaeota archaeon]
MKTLEYYKIKGFTIFVRGVKPRERGALLDVRCDHIMRGMTEGIISDKMLTTEECQMRSELLIETLKPFLTYGRKYKAKKIFERYIETLGKPLDKQRIAENVSIWAYENNQKGLFSISMKFLRHMGPLYTLRIAHMAIDAGDLETIKRLIEKGANPNEILYEPDNNS